MNIDILCHALELGLLFGILIVVFVILVDIQK
jgi:hypothetical protein